MGANAAKSDVGSKPMGRRTAKSGVGSGFFASAEDVASTVKQLARSGMTLEKVAMAFVSQSIE